jgi:TatD DNase family protein
MIDPHCHVQFNAYKKDMHDVIQRTLEKGVFMITVGTQKDTSKNGLEVAEKYDGLWASIGLHPNHTCEQEFWDDDELPPEKQATPKIKTRCESFDMDYYKELAKHPKCVAIGECGLDYYRIPENIDRDQVIQNQKDAVRAQFDLASEANLPVIIHSREAFEDQFAIVKEYVDAGKLQKRGVLHCFTGTREQAEQYIDIGFMISFTGIITFPPRKNEGDISPIQQVVKDLPLESIMVETDAPYLSPEPYRGKRNEPWHVKFVAQKIADLKGISLEEVDRVTTENAKSFFNI